MKNRSAFTRVEPIFVICVIVILSFVVVVSLPSCKDQFAYVPPATETKTIFMKEAVIEQRMGFDPFADEPLRQKTVTIYYIIAEDGTVAEVGLTDFARAKIGDTFTSSAWREKH